MKWRAGEMMGQCLRVCAVLERTQVWFVAPTGWLTAVTLAPGNPVPSSVLYRQNTHTHKQKLKK